MVLLSYITAESGGNYPPVLKVGDLSSCPPCSYAYGDISVVLHMLEMWLHDSRVCVCFSLRRGEKVKKSRCDVEFDSVDSDEESSTQRDTGPAL